MPRRDGTGPMGLGPMTGRGLGFCNGFSTSGFTNSFVQQQPQQQQDKSMRPQLMQLQQAAIGRGLAYRRGWCGRGCGFRGGW